jgi:CPA2 family monovalent cation:H+ antiporter-2
LLRRIADWGSRELFLITVVAIGVGVGSATHLAGLSFALGAFVAGIVLSESEFSHQALSDVVPIRDIFGLLFFVSVGMLLDPGYAVTHAGQIAVVVLLTFLGKSIIAGGIARAFGYVNMAPWIVGLGLSQIGEFSFVLARAGLTSGSLSRSTYNLVLTCTVLTMALSPMVSRMALPLGRAWRRWQKPAPISTLVEGLETPPDGHAIVAGFGRSGKAAARILQRAGIPLVIVEINHSIFGALGQEGLSGIWGDITGEEILKAAGVGSARMLLMSLPDQHTVRLAVQRARQLNPHITVIARAMRAPDVEALRKIGVDTVIQVEFEGGIEMVRQALIQYQNDEIVVSQLIEDLRRDFYGRDSKLT